MTLLQFLLVYLHPLPFYTPLTFLYTPYVFVGVIKSILKVHKSVFSEGGASHVTYAHKRVRDTHRYY